MLFSIDVQFYPGVQSPDVPLLDGPLQDEAAIQGGMPMSTSEPIQVQSNVPIQPDWYTFTNRIFSVSRSWSLLSS